MSADSQLSHLLQSMDPVLHPEEFVFCSVNDPRGVDAVCTFREREGWTVICRRDEAERLGWPFTFPCRMITLNVLSSLEAVGFLAEIAAALVLRRIPVNVVSAYHHDHLFVRLQDADQTICALAELQRAAQL